MAITLTYDAVLSRVRIAATGLSVLDTYTRSVSNSFGTADSGQVYTTAGGAAADYAVNGSRGVITLPTGDTAARSVILPNVYADVDYRGTFRFAALATGAPLNAYARIRHVDIDNYYRLQLEAETDGSVDAMLTRVVAGSGSTLATVNDVATYSAASDVHWRVVADGFDLRAKVWTGDPIANEPLTWTVEATDATEAFPTGQVGIRAQMAGGNTNTNPTVSVDNLSAVPTVIVERSVDQIRWTTVRGGTALVPTSGAINLDDYEFAPDVANFYRVIGQSGFGPALNPNTSFEVDTSGWTGQSATCVRSTAQAHDGAASLLITPNGVAASGGVIADGLVPVTSGEVIRVSLWAYSPAGWSDLRPLVDWHDSAAAFLSSGLGVGFVVPAATWTYLEQILTVPVGAAFAKMRGRHGGTPTAGDIWYADQIELRPPGITPVLDGVWLKSLARPFLNRKVEVRRFSPVRRRSRSGIFPIVGRSLPVAVTDLQHSREWTLDVNARSVQEAEELDLLISTGEVQFVHVPPTGRDAATPGGYVALGDTTEEALDTVDLLPRVFSLPLTGVAAPGPDVIPAVGTWSTVINTYVDWNGVIAGHADWSDLLQLVGSVTDVIVP